MDKTQGNKYQDDDIIRNYYEGKNQPSYVRIHTVIFLFLTSLLDCVTDRCVCHACWLKFQYTKVKITVCNIYASRLLHLSLCVCFKNI